MAKRCPVDGFACNSSGPRCSEDDSMMPVEAKSQVQRTPEGQSKMQIAQSRAINFRLRFCPGTRGLGRPVMEGCDETWWPSSLLLRHRETTSPLPPVEAIVGGTALALLSTLSLLHLLRA